MSSKLEALGRARLDEVDHAFRPGHQSQFSPLLQAQVKADSPFAELVGWIQANLGAPLDVPALAARAGLSERSFHRKFAAATGETPARFVEAARLAARVRAALRHLAAALPRDARRLLNRPAPAQPGISGSTSCASATSDSCQPR